MPLNPINQLDLDLHGLDGSLSDRLVAIGALSQSKVNGLPSALSDLASDISAEETRALAAEGVLAGDIAAEESRAMAAELQLGNDIASEAGSRISGDQVLQSAIDAVASDLAQEILDRQGAITGVSGDISQVASDLAAETLARQNSDAGLSGDIADVASDLAAETSRATGEELSIRSAFAAADAATLVDAKAYTDTKVAALVDGAPAMLDTLNELAAAINDDENFATTVLNAVSSEQTRAETAEGLLDGRLDVLEAKQWRQAVILSASQGTTSLAKPVGAPAIPDNAAEVMVFIDGRKVFYGSQFTVAAGGGEINFLSLRAQQSVEVLYFA